MSHQDIFEYIVQSKDELIQNFLKIQNELIVVKKEYDELEKEYNSFKFSEKRESESLKNEISILKEFNQSL